MKNCQVIIVSTSSLFVDAVSRLLEEKEIQVMASAKTIEDFQSLLSTYPVDSIVVDHNDSQLNWPNLVLNKTQPFTTCRIVFLSLTDNEMMFHYQERIENVIPAQLIKAICFSESIKY